VQERAARLEMALRERREKGETGEAGSGLEPLVAALDAAMSPLLAAVAAQLPTEAAHA
jgi:hypothetical protein